MSMDDRLTDRKAFRNRACCEYDVDQAAMRIQALSMVRI